ncbi:MAG: hypothetical protein K9L70_15425 [Thiohalocapsa sp.]|nr:hypothetical protein [Thiohalocapsa sp.]MCF7991103.1 hypothetical protein [Thiohalocapsa sp.]
MNRDRLDGLVQELADGADGAEVGVLSTGEACYVALAAGRYDLLPETYRDPIAAWYRLGPDWRRRVCEWRDWPESYVGG